MRKAVIGLLFVCAMPGAALADCVVDPWSIPYMGSNVTAYVGARAGEQCQIPVYVGGTNTLQSIAINSPPGNGTAVVGQGDIIYYQPNPGFAGQDAFSFSVTGGGPGGSGTSIVQVRLTVR